MGKRWGSSRNLSSNHKTSKIKIKIEVLRFLVGRGKDWKYLFLLQERKRFHIK
jgi:hypothetical protein